MITVAEVIECPICYSFYIEPYECINCNNNFCKKCYEDLIENAKKRNNKSSCPLCKKTPFLCKPNYVLNELVKSRNIIRKVKCYFCKKEFEQIEKLLDHFSQDKLHKKCIIKLMNNIKPCNLKQAFYFYEKENNKLNLSPQLQLIQKIKNKKKEEIITSLKIDDEEYSSNSLSKSIIISTSETESQELSNNNLKRYYFKNFIAFIHDTLNPKPQTQRKQDNFEIIKTLANEYKYFEECDLIYCGRNNNLNCECCKDGICKPGNCFCRECMELNKQYHCLKNYYLINKEGRVARYENKTFQCYATFERIKKAGKNSSKVDVTCTYSNPCNACKNLTQLMNKYLSSETINYLKSKF